MSTESEFCCPQFEELYNKGEIYPSNIYNDYNSDIDSRYRIECYHTDGGDPVNNDYQMNFCLFCGAKLE